MSFEIKIQEDIWKEKYRLNDTELNWADTSHRVCDYIYQNDSTTMCSADSILNHKYFDNVLSCFPDQNNNGTWKQSMIDRMNNLEFIPGGRITEGSGTKNPYLLNCYCLDIEDNIEDIYEKVKQVAIISKKNGGVN